MASGGKYWFPSTSTVLVLSASTAPSHIAFAIIVRFVIPLAGFITKEVE